MPIVILLSIAVLYAIYKTFSMFILARQLNDPRIFKENVLMVMTPAIYLIWIIVANYTRNCQVFFPVQIFLKLGVFSILHGYQFYFALQQKRICTKIMLGFCGVNFFLNLIVSIYFGIKNVSHLVQRPLNDSFAVCHATPMYSGAVLVIEIGHCFGLSMIQLKALNVKSNPIYRLELMLLAFVVMAASGLDCIELVFRPYSKGIDYSLIFHIASAVVLSIGPSNLLHRRELNYFNIEFLSRSLYSFIADSQKLQEYCDLKEWENTLQSNKNLIDIMSSKRKNKQ